MNMQFQRHVVAALTLLCAAATAPCAAEDSEPPALVIFDTPGVARNLSPLTEDGEATLKSLSEDANISMLRIGHSAPEAALQATAFSLTLSPASGHAVQFRDVERTDHPNGMVSLYAQDHAAGSETSIVIDGLDVLAHLYHAPTQFLATSYGYDTQNRQVALQLRAQGSFRRLFCGSLLVRGRCPEHRRWPVGVVRRGWACAHASSRRRRVGRWR